MGSDIVTHSTGRREESLVGAIAELLAALESVRAGIGEARNAARSGAEKLGESYEHLSVTYDAAGNPLATGALSKMNAAADSLPEADRLVAEALDDLGEYIEVVKGKGSGGGGSATSVGGGRNPSAHLRDMPPFPGTDKKTHGRAVGKGGTIEPVVSGEREDGVKRSHVTINNPQGPCQGELSCDTLLPVWLDQGSELTVHWRDDQGRDQSKTYMGEPDEH